MPTSWTVRQIIFTAGTNVPLLSIHFVFHFPLSLYSVLPSDCALFDLKTFSSGTRPELLLRCFQHFLNIPNHSFLLFSFLLQNPSGIQVEAALELIQWSVCAGAIADKLPIVCSLRSRCPKRYRHHELNHMVGNTNRLDSIFYVQMSYFYACSISKDLWWLSLPPW